jgi:peptidylprolyl isomerase
MYLNVSLLENDMQRVIGRTTRVLGAMAALSLCMPVLTHTAQAAPKKNQAKKAKAKAKTSKTRTLPGGLKVTDLRVGTGAVARAGRTVTVHYRGTLTNGTKFDASYDRGEPFSFLLGGGQVIKGWDQGVAGMKVGGKRKLVIPGSLAYGPNSPTPAIPPNATLVFVVELLKVE